MLSSRTLRKRGVIGCIRHGLIEFIDLDSVANSRSARERYVLRVTCYNICYTSFTLLLFLMVLCLWLGRVDNDDSGRKTEMFEIIPMLNNIKVNFHLCIALPLKFKIA